MSGKTGSFTLVHNGYMSPDGQELKIEVLHGSGSGELENISGSLRITQEDGGHQYTFNYEL